MYERCRLFICGLMHSRLLSSYCVIVSKTRNTHLTIQSWVYHKGHIRMLSSRGEHILCFHKSPRFLHCVHRLCNTDGTSQAGILQGMSLDWILYAINTVFVYPNIEKVQRKWRFLFILWKYCCTHNSLMTGPVFDSWMLSCILAPLEWLFFFQFLK